MSVSCFCVVYCDDFMLSEQVEATNIVQGGRYDGDVVYHLNMNESTFSVCVSEIKC